MQIRHGDVHMIKVKTLPKDVTRLDRKELAYGEVTGHAHRIDVGELFESKNGELYLKVDSLTKVSHEEHRQIELPVGIYRIAIKRQYNPEGGWDRVCD